MARPNGGWIGGGPAAGSGRAVGSWAMREVLAAQQLGAWPRIPTSVSGLRLWLDGADASTMYDATSGGSLVTAGSGIARWEDKSGNAAHATQATSGARPTRQTNVRNGNGIVRFNGTSQTMQVSSITLPTYCTVIVVSSTTVTGGVKFWVEHGAGVSTNAGFAFLGTYSGAWVFNRSAAIHQGPAVDGTDWIGSGWQLASLTYDGTGRIYKNSSLVSAVTAQGTARSNSNVTTALNIGSRNQSSLWLSGDVGAMLIYDSVLSDTVRTSVENWLRQQWAI